jgi:hypothetical protein
MKALVSVCTHSATIPEHLTHSATPTGLDVSEECVAVGENVKAPRTIPLNPMLFLTLVATKP